MFKLMSSVIFYILLVFNIFNFYVLLPFTRKNELVFNTLGLREINACGHSNSTLDKKSKAITMVEARNKLVY